MKQHTNEEIMKFFDIKPGDRFEYLGDIYVVEDVLNFSYYVKCRDDKSLTFTTCEEVQEKIKELPRLVKVGDMQCSPENCNICPLKFLACRQIGEYKDTLFKTYYLWSRATGYHIPELEQLLDKEVPEK